MAKVVELAMVVRLSRLVKDGVDETKVFPSELESTVEEMVGELVNDPAAVIEVAKLNAE